jgi:hypothetical protein
MPTWGEIQEFSRSKYKLSVDEEERFSIVWGYDNDRSQQIWVRHLQVDERDWIEFRTYVCHAGEMKPEVALAKNLGFVIGALAVDSDGDYVMVHNAMLATLDPDEFELPLRILANTADQLEKDHSGADDF